MANGLQDLVQQLTFSKLGKMLEGLEGFGQQGLQFGQQGVQQGNPFGQQQNQMQQMGNSPMQQMGQPQQQEQQPEQEMISREQLGLQPKKETTAQRNSRLVREENKRKADQKDRDFRFKEQQYIDKQNHDWNEKVLDMSENAFEDNNVFRVMQALDDNDQLDTPQYLTTLKKLGLDYDFLKKPGSKEFEKMSTTFLRGLKPIFGGRITDNEVKLYMRGIPDLMQTKEGRRKLYRDLSAVNEVKMAYAQARNDLIEGNGGEQPKGLREKTFERVKPQATKIYNNLIEQIGFNESSPGKRHEELPDYKKYPLGKKFTNRETGQRVKRTETGWAVVKEGTHEK